MISRYPYPPGAPIGAPIGVVPRMATGGGHQHCIVPAASAAQRRHCSGDVLGTIQLEDLGQTQGPWGRGKIRSSVFSSCKNL